MFARHCLSDNKTLSSCDILPPSHGTPHSKRRDELRGAQLQNAEKERKTFHCHYMRLCAVQENTEGINERWGVPLKSEQSNNFLGHASVKLILFYDLRRRV